MIGLISDSSGVSGESVYVLNMTRSVQAGIRVSLQMFGVKFRAVHQMRDSLVFVDFLEQVLVRAFELPKFAFTKTNEDIPFPVLRIQFIKLLQFLSLRITAK